MFNRILKYIKKYIPKSIFSRFLLIILIPIIIIQALNIYIFIDNYWSKANKKAINILIREFFILNKEFNIRLKQNNNIETTIKELSDITTLSIRFYYPETTPNKKLYDKYLLKRTVYNQFFIFDPVKEITNLLSNLEINSKMYFQKEGKNFILYIEKQTGYFCIEIPSYRIIGRSLSFFVMWAILPAFFLALIVYIFAKNQINSITKLTNTMIDFCNLEKENESFKPTGAIEIRNMSIAFLKMQKEIKKYINSRTLLLAEISHDLRTPLTRIKLEAEFIEDETIAQNIKKDLVEMEKMINEYLYFAKGENEEKFTNINIKEYFNNIIKEYSNSSYNNIKINYVTNNNYISVKPLLFKRAINNIINNSLKYAKNIFINIYQDERNKINIIFEDDGCGVSDEFYQKVTKSFYQVEQDINVNKNLNINNFGLGLAIVKKIIFVHNAELFFNNSQKYGGFLIKIVL